LENIQRTKFAEETILREQIQGMLKLVLHSRGVKENNQLVQEEKLRGIIRELILQEAEVPDTDPAPNRATGINELETLLKNIVPNLETSYKSLTTDLEQRKSFRAHIINAVENTLTPPRINNQASAIAEALGEITEVDVEVGDATEDPAFIPIDDRFKPDKPSEEEEFASGLEGSDETGRNKAFQAFKSAESQIVDAYELLSNETDQQLFYDYLITNLKLYFDKFEEDLQTNVEEPTTDAYEREAGSV
tara:strand:- start:479 stop:1222 length:744 start_codon:yes stop_codon:yes gene_type:complete